MADWRHRLGQAREFMSRYDFPILFDYLVSMPHGPVTSMTLNFMNGLEAERTEWEEFVVGRAGNKVGIARQEISFEELDQLSEAEMHVLEATWDQFGRMSSWELRNYTHIHCPEWEDPHGSSYPIPYERVLKFLGKEHSTEIAQEIDSLRSLDKFLAHAE
jgi:uncharacterized phage-associated protein